MRSGSLSFLFLAGVIICIGVISSCANIMPPGGGPKDSLPPVLVNATPRDSAVNVNTDRITLTFDEYIEQLQNLQENLVVSPNPVTTPTITSRLRTITIRLRDSLLPNTTYSIDFGNSIRDVNEGNVLKNFTYVFSTGSSIDSNSISGRVTLAENGKVDSTLVVVLHRNLNDTAIQKLRPLYFAKLDGQGNFRFNNLPRTRFAIYVTENDFQKQYDDSTELFAFSDTTLVATPSSTITNLYAFRAAQKIEKPATNNNSANRNTDRRLRYSTNLNGSQQDLLTTLDITFNRPLRSVDTNAIRFTDTNFVNVVRPRFSLDSTSTKLSLQYPWKENTAFKLILPANAFTDTAGANLPKSDTLNINTRSEADYASLRLVFNNIDTTRNTVIQLVQSDKVVASIPVTSRQWYRKLFPPGEYEVRVLYDRNKNGVWDTGSFGPVKRQPEIVIDLRRRLNIRANWDNEEIINL